jgi:hypothetical protein
VQPILLAIEPIEIATGHFPMIEEPAALTNLLDRLFRSA